MKLNKLKEYIYSVNPFGFLNAILLVIANFIIIYFLDNITYRILCLTPINQEFIFTMMILLFNFANSMVSVFLLFYLFSHKSSKTRFKFKTKLSDYIIVLLIILSFRIFYDNIIFPFTEDISFNTNLYINRLSILNFFNTVISAPITEELLYRGLLLNGLSKKYSPFKAIFISSFIFSIMHSNIVQGINAFVISLIISYIFLSTKSLKLSIAMHFFNNIIVSLFGDLLLFNSSFEFMFILPLTVFLFFYLFKRLNNRIQTIK